MPLQIEALWEICPLDWLHFAKQQYKRSVQSVDDWYNLLKLNEGVGGTHAGHNVLTFCFPPGPNTLGLYCYVLEEYLIKDWIRFYCY